MLYVFAVILFTTSLQLLTMYFLQLLTDGLCSNDLYHLSVPVLALQLLISKHIIDHSATVTLVHLRYHLLIL